MKYDALKYVILERGRVMPVALAVGLLGLVVSGLGWMTDAPRFYHAWLTAFLFWLSLALAGLFFTMLHYLTAARWSVVLRRVSEAMMLQLPWLALAFVPVLLGMHDLFEWSHPETVASDHLLKWKSGYLNVPFFIIRAVVYFGIWGLLAYLLRKKSLAQDIAPQQDHISGLRKVSAVGMLLFAVTITFAAFDWLMSLAPHWYSTIFGVYYFGGLFLAGVSAIALLSMFLRRNGILRESITVEHYHDLGKLMFAFIIFWAYIGFSQYFLIWYGNIPEETIWFLARWQGGWKGFSLFLLFGHFIIPFVYLIFQGVKRRIPWLGLGAVLLVVMHWVDMYWLVYPVYFESGPSVGWIELAPVVGLGGLFLAGFWRSFSSHSTVPVGDPWLEKSIKFRESVRTSMNDHPSEYEHRDTNIRRIFLTALAAVIFIVIVVISALQRFHQYSGRDLLRADLEAGRAGTPGASSRRRFDSKKLRRSRFRCRYLPGSDQARHGADSGRFDGNHYLQIVVGWVDDSTN